MIKTIKGVEKKSARTGKLFAKITFEDCSANVFDTKVIETADANINKNVDVEFVEKDGYKNIVSLVAVQPNLPLTNPGVVYPSAGISMPIPVIEYPDGVKLNLDCLDRAIRITTVCQTVDSAGVPMKLDRMVLYRLAEDIKKWAKGVTK